VRAAHFGVTAVVTVALVSLVACAPKPPDFQSILSTTTSAAATTTARPVPFSKYLEGIGVTGVAVAPHTLTDLTASIPTPPGWAPLNNSKLPPTTEVISKGGKYPAAMLAVFRLQGGDFNAADAVKHANADAQLVPNFTQLDASTNDFNGFPSSMIQGSYDAEGMRMHSYNRIVLPTGSPPARQRYLVQLTITSLAADAVAQSSDIEAIIRGFVVAAK
jgi:Probable lipoprotein LpqN